MKLSQYLQMAAIVLLAILNSISYAQQTDREPVDSTSATGIPFHQWLVVSMPPSGHPVFHDVQDISKKRYGDAELLHFREFNIQGAAPVAKGLLAEVEGRKLTWQCQDADAEGFLQLPLSRDSAQVVYLATRIRTWRWLTADLEIRSGVLMKAWLDGTEIGVKLKADTLIDKAGRMSKKLKLERGSHLLMIKVVIPANHPSSGITATLSIRPPFAPSDLEITTHPADRKNIRHMLDGIKITDISLSHDGRYYLISYRQSLPPGDQSESWSEIRVTRTRELVQSYRHARVSQIRWMPADNRISYIVYQNDLATLFLFDPEKRIVEELMKGIAKFAGYSWSPTAGFLVYSVREEPEQKDGVIRHVQGMPDRQPGWRNRTHLYRYDVASGLSTRLTWGNLSASLQDISPDGGKILFSQHFPDFSERPYSKQHLFILDLKTMSLDTILFNATWGVRASFSPDGKSLLAIGGPEAFNGAGLNIPDGMIPHNSDQQVYMVDIQTKNVRCITLDFNPSVNDAVWHKTDKALYLLTNDKDFRRLYRYDLTKGNFSPVETGLDYITTMSIAPNGLVAVIGGNQANRYPAWYTLDLKSRRMSVLEDAEASDYKDVEFGEVRSWNFTASSGVEISGRVYYPPGYDPEKKYPVIVYYYGGINPVGRTFAGRYPFNLWAGHGYIVYIPQPSGAVGFGQAFSAAHVNNWGITVADEIIEGTKKFLDAHPNADRARVGCAGASYGGFMTMLLLTRTDIFAAAISHAGISSISSYWGEGYWGYAYSAGASAGSFPWNNKDLYIGQSPLFHADKITTPLLLVTGDEDTNVPPGESIQMFTALKLLGRPVELVLVKGEDHQIVTYSKRIQWHNTIMAWWDKYLKGQPEWWEDLYPAGNY
jgi:dipeptidyl aminopeptidase/acylaminoacyl peptidase